MTSSAGRLAIIPARGGSKRIHRKNLAILNGQPLIWYTIDVALRSGLFTRIIVSTEDSEIAAVSLHAGAEVFDRDESLAGDHSTSNSVILKVLGQVQAPDDWRLFLLEPTSPLRTCEDLTAALALFESHPDALSLVSYSDYEFPAAMALKMEGDFLTPIFPEHYVAAISTVEGVPRWVRPNGAIYLSRCGDFTRYETFYTSRTIAFEMPEDRSLDIDTPRDLRYANWMLANDPPPGWRVPLIGQTPQEQ